MSKKIVRRNIPSSAAELANFHPLLQRIYASREVCSAIDVDRELLALESFTHLKDIDRAVERLALALREQQRILIIGDFDADGATSTAVAVSVLRAFGAENVDFVVPSRFTYGYGLSPQIVDSVKDREPQLIVTVDNGIASHAGIERANELGIDVVVTDHHLATAELPAAHAIVNPNQPGDEFSSKSLAGVGVIFYVMIALRAKLKELNWFAEKEIACPSMAQYLDLVALGTVADVVPLDKNNRILVYQGLRRIRAGYARPGIMALLKIANRRFERTSSADLSFAVAPRLNAADV